MLVARPEACSGRPKSKRIGVAIFSCGKVGVFTTVGHHVFNQRADFVNVVVGALVR